MVGGAGYVGSALVARLLTRGARVRVVDRFVRGSGALAALAAHPHLEIAAADVGSPADLARALDGCSAVVHLAAVVGDAACDAAPERAERVNVESTRALVAASRERGCRRLVFTSTCAVYAPSRRLLDETSATAPHSLYARTKLAAERIVLDGAGAGMASTVLRLASLYGVSGCDRRDLVVNGFVARALAERRIAVHGGRQRRPFLHVDDAARAVLAVLAADPERVRGRVLNAGAENHAILRVAQLVARAVPGTRIEVQPAAAGAPDYRVDCEELPRRTGFVPLWTVQRGIRQLRRAYGGASRIRAAERGDTVQGARGEGARA